MAPTRLQRFIRAALFLFPAEFRLRYGPDMLRTFEDRWRDRPDWKTAARTVADLAAAACSEQMSTIANRTKKRKGDRLVPMLTSDLRFAVRTLRRSPGFTVVVLLALSLGIGLNTAMFSIAYTVLWRLLPYPDPDRIVSEEKWISKTPEIIGVFRIRICSIGVAARNRSNGWRA